jgi:hypothetical protein
MKNSDFRRDLTERRPRRAVGFWATRASAVGSGEGSYGRRRPARTARLGGIESIVDERLKPESRTTSGFRTFEDGKAAF